MILETIPVDGTIVDFTNSISSDTSYTPPTISDIMILKNRITQIEPIN